MARVSERAGGRFGAQTAQRRAQAALHAVALDRAAGLARGGEAEARRLRAGVVLGAAAGLKGEGRRMAASALGGRLKIGAANEPADAAGDLVGGAARIRRASVRTRRLARRAQADRRLRPRARRAFSTLRPPTVAMRARKPWRRLRTSLEG
jgi:hypothetical protein